MSLSAKMLCLVRQANSVLLEVEVDQKAKGQEVLDKVILKKLSNNFTNKNSVSVLERVQNVILTLKLVLLKPCFAKTVGRHFLLFSDLFATCFALIRLRTLCQILRLAHRTTPKF